MATFKKKQLDELVGGDIYSDGGDGLLFIVLVVLELVV